MSSDYEQAVVHTTSGDEGMIDRPDARATSAASSSPAAERRRRVALRRLVDEMLDEIRAAANEDNWNAVSRSQAEADLARIMTQVRREAVKRPNAENSRRLSTAKSTKSTKSAKGAKRRGSQSAKRGSKQRAGTSTSRAKRSAERVPNASAKRSAGSKQSARKRSKAR